MSVIIVSRIDRRPRAPVPRLSAFWATARSDSASNVRLHILELEQLRVLLGERVLGLDQDAHERVFVERFEGHHDRKPADQLGDEPEPEQIVRLDLCVGILALSTPACALAVALKPICWRPVRASMIFSRPSKAPPQMNRMSLVLIWMYSCWGCLRPPCGGTDAIVPSRILSRACCTPSPETSRVMLGFSDFRAILSISSM